MLNYARGIPTGDNGGPMFGSPPAVPAISTKVRETAATAGVSSILVLNDNTTAIEVSGGGGAAFIKWLTWATVDSSVAGTSVIANAAAANYDNMVPANTVRRFVVPVAESITPASYGVQSGKNRQNGLYKNVAIIGVGSVLTTEY